MTLIDADRWSVFDFVGPNFGANFLFSFVMQHVVDRLTLGYAVFSFYNPCFKTA